MKDDTYFMGLAIEEARKGMAAGNMPVGSVIVKDGTVVGRGHNTVISGHDVTAHAETEALRDACRKLNTEDLTGATCYTGVEPCPMCLWAIVLSGVSRLVIAARHVDLGATHGSYAVERLLEMTGRKLEVVSGVRRDESLKLRRGWSR
ncbi:MAG: nucleoside deaminase [Proteobacteria bacterium]|nr:nucleoside deaminase [Pseudomonadota bacterium]